MIAKRLPWKDEYRTNDELWHKHVIDDILKIEKSEEEIIMVKSEENPKQCDLAELTAEDKRMAYIRSLLEANRSE